MSILREGKTKDGRSYVIRHVEAGDVESALRYINRLSQERTFVRVQGEEVTLEDEQKFIDKQLKNIEEQKGVALVLVVDGEVHGICNVGVKDKTESHTAALGLGVDVAVRGEGFGRMLMELAIEEVRKLPGVKKIILSVKGPNDIARSLYERLGFVEYGMLPKGTRHRGELIDMHYMYKDL